MKNRVHLDLNVGGGRERVQAESTRLQSLGAIQLRVVDERGEPVYPPHSLLRKVSSSGVLAYDARQIHVGSRWAGATLRVIQVGPLVHMYYGEELIRVLAIDPTRDYQPSGKEVRLAARVT